MMEPGERIFNPSRETDRLLAQAEAIGPHTFGLCEKWFHEEGRSGQRRMYGLVNLIRHYPLDCVERAAKLAKDNGVRSSKALRRMVESMAAEAEERKAERCEDLTQEHALIRSGEDYGAFFHQHAAQGVCEGTTGSQRVVSAIGRDDLPRIWQRASWPKVIEIFGLNVEEKRRSRDDEMWLKSPFAVEQRASMHVSLSANIYKDFSSGKGGGIMQFCREMLGREGREMTMFEVAQWMVAEGISTAEPQSLMTSHEQRGPGATGGAVPCGHANRAIAVDLRRYLRPDHPEWGRRGISAATCRYLGCGFLPHRATGQGASPLNGRLVFQVRNVRENGHALEPIILSHSGRALSREQEDTDGKYWSYPFRKGWEIYNQDQLLLDEGASRQASRLGLILVEGFFDVAKLVEADCRNVGALMGAHISAEQIERLKWIRSRIGLPRIVLFLDRDQAGREGARKAAERLRCQGFEVKLFDWDRHVPWNGRSPGPIPESVQDPADMPVEQLHSWREQGIM
jgi:5S rRNA maturation endonuclease (ribonuclease M5)